MKLTTGKTYLITADRKGTFMMLVTRQDETWTYGVVAGGKTKAMLDYNVREQGESVTCRSRFIRKATEQPMVSE